MAQAGLSSSEPGANLSAWVAKIMAWLNGSTALSQVICITRLRPQAGLLICLIDFGFAYLVDLWLLEAMETYIDIVSIHTFHILHDLMLCVSWTIWKIVFRTLSRHRSLVLWSLKQCPSKVTVHELVCDSYTTAPQTILHHISIIGLV